MLSAHFKLSEFACPHCHEAFVRPALVQLLERIRVHTGRPLRIVSGYRCPVHNRAVGGAHDSQHVYAAAADLPAGTLGLNLARQLGAVGVGLKGEDAVHVDVRDGRNTTWHY